jgi:hypothetical protein
LIEVATVEHFSRMQLQPMQREYQRILADAGYVRALVDAGCIACVSSERVLGLGGRAHAWAMLANNIGISFVALHRAARRLLDASPYRRIEMVTGCDFSAAQRWARQLGFEPEAQLRAWFPSGAPAVLWSRVRA